jgi:hypothetical protein
MARGTGTFSRGSDRREVHEQQRPPQRVAVRLLKLHRITEDPGMCRRSENEVSGARCSLTSKGLQIERRILPCPELHRRFKWVKRYVRRGRCTLQRVDSLPPDILYHRVPEPSMGCTCLRLLFIEVMFFVFAYFRGVNHRWHGATPCRRIRLIRAGLPLAEQSARRYWRGVEGGTVLNL